jgi:Cu/Ag efflux pump CusA
MGWLIGSSLRFGRLVVAAAIGMLVLGAVQLGGAKVDVFPEYMPPTVQVQTEALGLSAAEVEQLITLGLEQDLLNGVPWLDHIHSRSEPGLSVIDLVFERGTDVYAARQMVQERLTQAHALPNVGSPPIMIEPLASAGRVAMIGMSSSSVSLIDMSVLARWKIKPKLMGVPGVANVAVYGQRDRQLQVQVDPARLRSANVSLTQVIETAGNALWVSPLTFVEASTPGTGGFVEGNNQRLAVQHVLPITTAQNLARVPVVGAAAGTLRLGDVAQVVEDHQPLIGDAVGSGDPTLFLVIQKFPDANTREVTLAVEQAMHDLSPGLGGITVDTSVYRPADFIDAALRTDGLAVLGGLVLLAALLLALFSSWRAAVISLLVLPVSVVTALYVMYLRGQTLTTMTLAGLAVAMVLVVDDAVGDMDAIRRRLRVTAQDGAGGSGPGGSVSGAVAAACRQSRQTLTFATVVIGLAVLPFLVLDPVTSAFTRDVALSFALAMLASLLVALTLTPTLAVLLLRAGDATDGDERPGWLERSTDRLIGPRVGAIALRPTAAWAAVGLLAVAALAAVPQLGSRSFLPQVRDRDLLVEVATAPGTSLPEMTRVTDRMAAEIRTLDGVRGVGAHVGRAVTSDQFGDVNSGEIWIELSDGADYQATRQRIGDVAAAYPGVRGRLSTYSAARVSAALAGTEDDVVVRLFGQDYEQLGSTARQVQQAIGRVPGVRSPVVRSEPQQPSAQVEVDLAAADRFGLRPGDIRREATTLVSGLTAGNLYEQAKVFDVVVLGTPSSRADLTGLGDVLISTPAGGQVRLGDVAKITVATQPVAMVHDQVLRSTDVVAEVRGRGAAAVVADVRRAVAAVPMPAETHLQVLGAAEVRQVDLRRVLAWTAAVLALVLLVLQAATASWRRAALMMLVLPLGMVGGVLTAPLAGGVASTGGIAGLFAVLALTVRSGLVLVRRIRELEQVPGLVPGRLAAGVAARERSAPVIGSALATAALLLPVLLLGDRAGLEVLRPLAVTVLGGLVSSVIVTLVVLPAVCAMDGPADSSPTPGRTTDEPAVQPVDV